MPQRWLAIFFTMAMHQLAVAFVQARRVAANLRKEAHFVFGELRHGFAAVVPVLSWKNRASGRSMAVRNPGQRIQRRDGVPVLHA